MNSKKSWHIIKSNSKWVEPYKIEHPSDELQIKLMLNEKIKGTRIIGLRARILPGRVHRLHIHDSEFVLVYSLKGKCVVTVDTTVKTILPHTMIFIPPLVPHRFYNKFSKTWEGVAFAIGSKSKIKNLWME